MDMEQLEDEYKVWRKKVDEASVAAQQQFNLAQQRAMLQRQANMGGFIGSGSLQHGLGNNILGTGLSNMPNKPWVDPRDAKIATLEKQVELMKQVLESRNPGILQEIDALSDLTKEE